MKKTLLTLIILIGVTLNSFAQKADGSKFSIGIEAGLPVGDASNISSYAIGASLKYSHPIADKTYFTASGGYTYFPYKNDIKIALTGLGLDKSGEGFVPVKLGVKYFITDVFYGEGQVGAAISTESDGSTGFAYSPGIGLQFDKALDIGVRFESWTHNSTLSQFALRLAYCF